MYRLFSLSMLGHFTFRSKYVLYSLNISEGIQAFTLLVIFQLYYDKMFTEINNFLYTGNVNILS